MTMIRAKYQNGVFRPVEPVQLPEEAEVDVLVPVEYESPQSERARRETLEILTRSYETGQTDTAARHNEHQP